MAQAHISVAGVEIVIEDEDAGFRPVTKAALKLLLDLREQFGAVVDDEEDE